MPKRQFLFCKHQPLLFQIKTNLYVSVAEEAAVTEVFLVFVSEFEKDSDAAFLIFLLKMRNTIAHWRS
jgi:hypothetical protein